MLEHVTGDDVFAQIQMLRTVDGRTILLLESPADCGALDPHIQEDYAQTHPTYSKSALLLAMRLVETRHVERVIGLADRDLMGIVGPEEDIEGLFYTDLYDLDATILLGGNVLERILSTLTDSPKRQAHLSGLGVTERELILRLAGPVGVARLVSVREHLEVRFADFPLHECADCTAGHADLRALCVLAVSRSPAPKCDGPTLTTKVSKELGETPDLAPIANGHDLAGAITHLVRSSWGGAKAPRAFVEQAIRIALDCENLKQTGFYRDILAWSNQSGTVVWSCQ